MKALLIIIVLATFSTSCIGLRFGGTCGQFGLETVEVKVLDMDTTNPNDNFTQTEFTCAPKGKGNFERKKAL